MGDIQTRPFSKDYSGLINQSVIAIGLAAICITSHEVLKRRRRGTHPQEGLGSVESWQFGYLYQGRSWARNPSPPSPQGWPLSWVKDSINVPQDRLNHLRGIDATLYVRFLRGCRKSIFLSNAELMCSSTSYSVFFVLLHTFTTVPILLPIHIHFSSGTVSPKSMTRASIASLVLTPEGLELLWIHICLLFWITLTWIANLAYISNGAFKLRAAKIQVAARLAASNIAAEKDAQYHPHPHPQYPFLDIPFLDTDRSNRGLRLRTVMVSNVPIQLRCEKDLKEYFEYYMSRPIDKPSVGLTSSRQPGLIDKFLAFGFNRAKRIPVPLPRTTAAIPYGETEQSLNRADDTSLDDTPSPDTNDVPVIDRVVIARQMTELSSLLERREDILCSLEAAHIKLAKKVLLAVSREVQRRRVLGQSSDNATKDGMKRGDDIEAGGIPPSDHNMDLLISFLAPFVEEFDVASEVVSSNRTARYLLWHRRSPSPRESGHDLTTFTKSSPEMHATPGPTSQSQSKVATVWDALLNLPRHTLDPYQPLVHLSVLFRGKTVPSIDYYTAKLSLLTSLITQHRARAISDYDPLSTAFVTFKDPKDARKACKYLAAHPSNPLTCLVSMAPQYEDIDWTRVMKSTFHAELIKDWVVNLGVWGFTIFWLFPVSLFVGLVSIQSIANIWPSLYDYLLRHPWQEEIIQSFLPTILISLLTILIPLILLLIAKKAHTITTLSVLHDTIMTRYYKFLIVNVLVFFCVGTAALQSFLSSFRTVSGDDILQVVADSFPTAGPFYVGWLIFTTAVHGCLELVMFGLPLFMYPSTERQITPRKRAVGIRPRTFNFYYWLPNHLLIIHVCLLFAVLNPLVIPFGLVYLVVETAVVKNQLLHVYAKNYECNGHILLIRIVRYSLDGLMLSQFVFLAYMAVLKKTVNLALAAVLFILTAGVKVVMTRMCRTRFEQDDILEADVVCGTGILSADQFPESDTSGNQELPPFSNEERDGEQSRSSSRFLTWRMPEWINFSYSAHPRRGRPQRRQPNPFRPRQESFSRLGSVDEVANSREEPEPPSEQPHSESILGGAIHLTPAEEHASTPTPPPEARSLVERHPPHPAWDDEPRYDIPYDNPFYMTPISNVLWLPRNPFGLLDLDDTLDVRQSLTSEPGAGDLGPKPPDSATAPVQYSGMEEIDLPEGIRSRLVTSYNEDEVKSTHERRPSLFHRRTPSSSTSARSSVLQSPRGRSQTWDGRPGTARALSSEVGTESVRQRASSLLMPPKRYSSPYSRVRMVNPVSRPDLATETDLMRSTPLMPHGASGISLAHSTNVTTGEAVFNEAIAEEQLASEERLKREEAEASNRRRLPSPSWLASWVYSRVHT
ncbi:hypothetical protein F5I97DRAFT_1956518 [Phlebopus sp. FC_14]|nr:hypothetical protein F5I97DRAFT_1956518 [Phlebopus sp. FC_14]